MKSHLDFEVAPDSLILKYFFVSSAVCVCTPSSRAAYLCYFIGPLWMTNVHFQHVNRCVLINILQVSVSNNEKSRQHSRLSFHKNSKRLLLCFFSRLFSCCPFSSILFLPSIFLFT